MRTVLALLGGFAFSIAGYSLLAPAMPSGSDFLLVVKVSIWRILLLFVAMSLGCLAHALYAQLQTAKQPVRIRRLLYSSLRSKPFILSVLVSPIIFFAIYNLASQVPDDLVAFCLAFQNAFFWKAILGGNQQAIAIAEDTH